MRFLVTGGAGYIGSIVASQLLGAGHEVVVFDSLERGHRGAVPAGASLAVGELLDADAVGVVLEQPFDGVLHFAALALVGESVADPGRYFRVNVGGTLTLLEAMVAAGAKRLVFSSTAAVYGQPEAIPIAETAPTRPSNPYGASKLAADSLRNSNRAGASNGLGEDHDPETHLIPNILRAAAGINPAIEIYGTDYPTPDGTAIRDYIHIEDLAQAHLLALEGAREGEHRVFNLGNGSGFSVREVVAAAQAVTEIEIPTRECPRRPGDPPMLVAASDRIRSELGWHPQKPRLEEMVADAWEFAQARPRGYSE